MADENQNETVPNSKLSKFVFPGATPGTEKVYDVYAKGFEVEKTIRLEGDLSGSVVSDFNPDNKNVNTLNATIGDGKVTHGKIGDHAVQANNIADDAVKYAHLNADVKESDVSTGSSKLPTAAAVKHYVDEKVKSEGVYLGRQTVSYINNELTIDKLNNGDRVGVTDGGRISLGDFTVRAGANLTFWKVVNDGVVSTAIWQADDGEFKITQSPVTDPTSSGSSIDFIDSASQNANGEITVTKKKVRSAGLTDSTTNYATAGVEGVVALTNDLTSTAENVAATANAAKQLKDQIDTKQDALGFEGTYNKTTNKVVTNDYLHQEINSKVATLDAEVESSDGKNVQVKVTEADGKITAVNITTDNTLNASDIADKADKVENATSGNLAGLDASGNITDSGIDPDDLKTKQTAVDESGSNIKTLTRIQQNANGEITPTFSDIRTGTTQQTGVVQLQDTIGATETTDTKAATPKSVRDAINTLDATVNSTGGVNVSATVTEVDGKITGVSVTDNSETAFSWSYREDDHAFILTKDVNVVVGGGSSNGGA